MWSVSDADGLHVARGVDGIAFRLWFGEGVSGGGEPWHFGDRDVAEVDVPADVLKHVVGIGRAAREDVHRDEAEVGVRVGGAVALVEDDGGGETGRGIGSELVPDLADDIRASFFGPLSHGVQNAFVVETNLAGDIATVDKEMLAAGFGWGGR